MRLKVIACTSLTRELGAFCAGSHNTTEFFWLDEDCQSAPDLLRSTVQREIDKLDDLCLEERGGQPYDAIVLACGVCLGLAGVSSRCYPLVVPRAQNCAALLLGGPQHFRKACEGEEDLVWYTPGSLEREIVNLPAYTRADFHVYATACGGEYALALMALERSWNKKCGAAAFVQLSDVEYPCFQRCMRNSTTYLGWELKEYSGNSSFLRSLLDSEWDQSRFLLVPPGETFELSYQNDLIRLSHRV